MLMDEISHDQRIFLQLELSDIFAKDFVDIPIFRLSDLPKQAVAILASRHIVFGPVCIKIK